MKVKQGLLSRNRYVGHRKIVLCPSTDIEHGLLLKVNDMHCAWRAIYVRLDHHVGCICRPVDVKKENGFVWVTWWAHHEIKLCLAELTRQVAPEVRFNALRLLVLLLAVSPTAKALKVDVLHRPSALARCNEWVPAMEVLFVLETYAANATWLLDVVVAIHQRTAEPTRILCCIKLVDG